MSRVSVSRLLAIGAELTEREREVVRTLGSLRLMSHDQLAVLLCDEGSGASRASLARDVRRVLARLTGLRVLARLDRRIGGLRAGSAGYVYYLGPVGQRLNAYWSGQGLIRGRFRPEPGARHIRHRLCVSQLYIDLWQAQACGEVELLDFQAEPAAWRRSLDALGAQTVLKPDAFVRLGLGAYEDRYFVEVDLGTESRTVIRGKLRAYLDYYHGGSEQAEHDVFPRVLLLTDTDARMASLIDECARLPAEDWQLFTVNRLERFAALVTDRSTEGGHDELIRGRA